MVTAGLRCPPLQIAVETPVRYKRVQRIVDPQSRTQAKYKKDRFQMTWLAVEPNPKCVSIKLDDMQSRNLGW